MRRLTPWLSVWALTLALTALTTAQSLDRYRTFASGWAWDLAYNNQWMWALVKGDQTISVRPINSWGDEGPSIWTRTHLDPIRLAVLPFYAAYPRPETLIVAHNVIVWWLLPAAFLLLRSETDSDALALSGVALVPLTPLLWPLLWNDFREMALALPFVLLAVHGFRLRRKWPAAVGIVGMLASREEYGLMVASLALIPPKADEDVGTTYAWARAAVFAGAGWVLFGFFGYEHLAVSSLAPSQYRAHFGGTKPGLVPTSRNALDMLVFGLGSWSLLALAAPRVALLSLPWVVGVARGRWDLDQLSDMRWHHVRYTTPIVATVLAAGLLGYARAGTWAVRGRHGSWRLGLLWLAAAAGLWFGRRDVLARMDKFSAPITRGEAAELWRWIDRVGPDDAVLAAYEVTAPLSSRGKLYSDEMDSNKPRGYPRLGPDFRWVFLRARGLTPSVWTAQGFEAVHRGDFVWVFRRGGGPRP